MTETSPHRSAARQEMARLIEHSLHRSDATLSDLAQHCAEAIAHGFAGVMVNGSHITRAVHLLEDSETKVACCAGFPLGAADADAKRYEIELAIDQGAQRLEAAANLGRLKDGDARSFLRELRDLVEAADERPLGLYLDTGFLSMDHIVSASSMAIEAGLQGITLAGVNPLLSMEAILQQVRQVVGGKAELTANLQSCTPLQAIALLKAGANRFSLPESLALMAALDAQRPS